MAQPPLSAAIGKLERKLGVTLLERTSRRVTLTPAGAVLLEQGRIAVGGVGAAIERARRMGTQAGRLTVAGQHRAADLVFVPVSDLSPSEVMAAWPDTSRSRAVAGFVRAAVDVAASHYGRPPPSPDPGDFPTHGAERARSCPLYRGAISYRARHPHPRQAGGS